MELNGLTAKIIKAAIAVHQELGPGLLESVYQACLAIALRQEGLDVRTEVSLPVIFRDSVIHEHGFRLDLLIEDQIVLELKSVDKVQPVHIKQLLTYLRLAKKPPGLLINFNESLVKNGITRVANGVDI
ncbi:MAG: GxxExxY protein [Desulfuromonadales bacterium]|nr:GxxExxY protein [Desulfuromonadales bacterium]MDW7756843.1 GxxExxY protein [Desulfuromonadales bacterium]